MTPELTGQVRWLVEAGVNLGMRLPGPPDPRLAKWFTIQQPVRFHPYHALEPGQSQGEVLKMLGLLSLYPRPPRLATNFLKFSSHPSDGVNVEVGIQGSGWQCARAGR